jgi:hypothetical protein
MKRRKLFAELMSGVQDMESHRKGKITLRELTIKPAPPPIRNRGQPSSLNLTRPFLCKRRVISSGNQMAAMTSWQQDDPMAM